MRREAGFSLLELTFATAIMLVVTGSIFGMMNPSQGASCRSHFLRAKCDSSATLYRRRLSLAIRNRIGCTARSRTWTLAIDSGESPVGELGRRPTPDEGIGASTAEDRGNPVAGEDAVPHDIVLGPPAMPPRRTNGDAFANPRKFLH